MSLRFENSNPERFQHFCQALLLADFPDLQCFPVAQPDGGRDGLAAESATVLQVKFKRAGGKGTSDWMIEALQGELPKIQQLIKRGAKRYIMATNAAGTAHKDSGSVDKVQKWLADNLSIPAQCLWSDDLERRLDSAPIDLKIRYPEVLDGRDTLQLLVNQLLGPSRERQARAMRAFVTTQFEKDEMVKFKQVHLTNQLTDLFIDVSLVLTERFWVQTSHKMSPGTMTRYVNELTAEAPSSSIRFRNHTTFAMSRGLVSPWELGPLRVGAASFLLSEAAQRYNNLIVLQGGPGQGKSTLAQYVCQVHRARYLGNLDWLTNAPNTHTASRFRLPIKVDLRDLARHLGEESPTPEEPSLETYLSYLIHRLSGGQSFTVDDLMDVVQVTPTLLFLDGLDEIADVDQRKSLVASVKQSISRLTAMGCDLQVVVTSRPSVLSKPMEFVSAGFTILDLGHLDTEQIKEYADKWVVARGLDEEEKSSVESILREKLDSPHIIELTRNPMQLAILLSLIHSEGSGLPDQRTALYDRYLDLFLLRESEKDAAVRVHKTLLLAFVRHLAWTLQSEAESEGGSGSVSRSELRTMVREFLVAGGHSTELEALFNKGLERIYVLVERVEGLFEFEVQPLREFFAARHLYETAPIGTYRKTLTGGDRSQRFEAMAVNPFWLNVLRFYAGSYKSGEVSDLVFSLQELVQKGSPAVQLHARRVGAAILTDWVLSTKKFPQTQLIELLFDQTGAHELLNERELSRDLLALDPQCGQEVFRNRIFGLQQELPTDARPFMYSDLLAANGGSHLKSEYLQATEETTGALRTARFRQMLRSAAAADLSNIELDRVLRNDSPDKFELKRRMVSVLTDQPDLIMRSPAYVNELIELGLQMPGDTWARRINSNLLVLFLGSCSFFTRPWEVVQMSALTDDSLLRQDLPDVQARDELGPVQAVLRKIEAVRDFSETADDLWIGSLAAVEDEFGQSWFVLSAALASAGASLDQEKTRAANALFDGSVSPCHRARYARVRRGGYRWWMEQADEIGSDLERMFWVALAMRWSSPTVFADLHTRLEDEVAQLDEDQLQRVGATLNLLALDTPSRNDRSKADMSDMRKFSVPLAKLAFAALDKSPAACRLSPAQKEDAEIKTTLENDQLVQRLRKPLRWNARRDRVLKWLADYQLADVRNVRMDVGIRKNLGPSSSIPPKLAAEMVANPVKFPSEAFDLAVYSVLSSYEPKTLTAAAADGEWSWE